jgi:hypothetical protein
MTQDAATAVDLREANQFEISGPIAITYSSTTFGGEPQFSYRDAEGNREFAGAEITRVDDAVLGAFVSVVLDAQPDNFVRSFTLVVPAVRGELGSVTEFSTFGFETVALQNIAGPNNIEGVQHTYQVHQLSGVAKVVQP